MKRFFALAILSVFLCAGCGANTKEESSSPASSESSLESSAVTSETLDQEAFLEDYDYFWTALRENCPLLEPAKRTGIDVDQIEEDYRKRVESCTNLSLFYETMRLVTSEFNGFGHITLLETKDYDYYRNLYTEMGDSRAVQAEILTSKEVQKTYNQLKHYRLSQETPQVVQLSVTNAMPATTSITVEEVTSETMLITIPTFDANTVESDGPILREIYQEAQASGKKNLILDLTQNSGGSNRYWMDNIVAPNLSEFILYDQYSLVPMTEYNQRFYDTYGIAEFLHPISELPDFPNINEADMAAFDQFLFMQNFVEPSEDAPLFQGKIWVLTSHKVFSASDSFANYCKQTGFATLVGETTGGDGLGSGDPFLMELPNTHLVFRYTGFYGLNSDGSCNAEMGTTPDIPLAEGKTALETCLQAIEEGVSE